MFPLVLLALGCSHKLGPPSVTYADDVATLPLVRPSSDRKRWYVPVDAGEHGEWLLFVDTGYSFSTCDDGFIEALGTETRGTKTVRGELGNLTTSKAKLPPIAVGDHVIEDLVCLVRDLGATSSISDPDEVPVAGVLGIDALRPFRVELDPGAGEIRLRDPSTADRIPDGLHTVKIRREYAFGTRIRIPVGIEDSEASPILDTGASNTYVDGERLGLEASFVDANVLVRGSGPGGEIRTSRRYFEIDSMWFAGHQAAPITLTDRPRGPRAGGLLGLDVLDRYTVELDFARGIAHVRPVDPMRRPSWHSWRETGEISIRLVE